jgi:hypothetical protein
MRYANPLILLVVIVLATLTARMTPPYVESILQPAEDREQRQTLYETCRKTIEKYHARYGDRPLEKWPNEGDKLTYRNAMRILAELEEAKTRRRVAWTYG